MQTTEDTLLSGRVILKQPLQGYRVAIDPIFLAASIAPEPNDTVLDIGSGVGAASLCLAQRVPHCRIIGLEILRDYVRLAADNVILNNLRDRVEVLNGDLMNPPPRLAAGTFAHVMANPPYLEKEKANPSPFSGKATAHMEGSADFEQWARFCLLMVRPKGTVTFIHRADRLDTILGYFAGKLGDIEIYPLWPGANKPAKRVLIKGKKNTNGLLKLHPGMILHNNDGSYTPKADAILRNGAALQWDN